jgi:zinc protease
MGSTYVPFARHMSSRVWESYGYLLAGSEAPPEKLAEVHAAFRQIAGELAIRPIDDDELQRAVRPMLLNFDRERATNEYWLGALKDLSVDPRVEQLVASRSEAYRRITAADLQAAARDFFRPERALAVEVVKAPAITVMPPPVVTAPSS